MRVPQQYRSTTQSRHVRPSRVGQRCLALLVCLSASLFSTHALAQIIVDEGAENGLEFGALYKQSGNAPVASRDVAREGRASIKSYLNRETSAVPFRTEIAVTPRTEPTWGDHTWYAFSIYLPENYVPGDIWETVGQWHHRVDDWSNNTRPGPPPIKLGFENGTLDHRQSLGLRPRAGNRRGADRRFRHV